MKTFDRVLLITVGTMIGGVAALVVLGTHPPRHTPEQNAEAARQACDGQYGIGSRASLNCQVELLMHEADDDHRQRMDAAARAASAP